MAGGGNGDHWGVAKSGKRFFSPSDATDKAVRSRARELGLGVRRLHSESDYRYQIRSKDGRTNMHAKTASEAYRLLNAHRRQIAVKKDLAGQWGYFTATGRQLGVAGSRQLARQATDRYLRNNG